MSAVHDHHDPPSEIGGTIKGKETRKSPSPRLPKAGPSRVTSEMHRSIDLRRIDVMEVHHREMDRSPPPHEPDSSGVRPPVEPNGAATLDSHNLLFDTGAGRSSCDVRPHPEPLTADHPLSCSAPAQIRKTPVTNAPCTCRPPSGSISPHSPELPDADSMLAPDKFAPTSNHPDMATGCAADPVPPCESGDLHHLPLPQPPPEVAALLTAQSSGNVVSPVFVRNSPLVPWALPSEIGHFWLGLFRISEVKVTRACHLQVTDLTSLWVCLFGRWKRVRGEEPQTPSRRSAPGALSYIGYLVARIYSWMMRRVTIVNGPCALCAHGGSHRTPHRSKISLSNIPTRCFRFLFWHPLRRTLLRLATSQ